MKTWDLQRIMFYGFKAFSADYLTRHPGYYVNPHDINGSVIETVFGQMRYVAQQNLSSTNYASSRASLLTKWSLCGKRTGHDDYRDQPLYLKETKMRRKK